MIKKIDWFIPKVFREWFSAAFIYKVKTCLISAAP